MNEKNNEQLIRNHPDLFEKSGDIHFSIGDGWYNIIDILCTYMSHDVQEARRKLKFAMENQGNKYADTIPDAEARLTKALENLPIIQQVKEKFGTLRFYVDGGSEAIDNYISFAEAMSSVTCEECGAPGESRNIGWIKVLCDKHHRERSEYHERRSTFPKSAPKLSDECDEELL